MAGCRSAASTSRGHGRPSTARCSRCTTPARPPLEGGLLVANGRQGHVGLHRPELLPPVARRRARARIGCSRTCSRCEQREREPVNRQRVTVIDLTVPCFTVPCSPLHAVVAVLACGKDTRTPVLVYSPHGRDQLLLLEHEFERQHPDIDIRWLDMGSQEILDRLRFERVNPQADVWFGGPTRSSIAACRTRCSRPTGRRGPRTVDRECVGPGRSLLRRSTARRRSSRTTARRSPRRGAAGLGRRARPALA